MYELSKQVLQKVSFDKFLFRRELIKAINSIENEEVLLLKAWCIETFGTIYKNLITETFRAVAYCLPLNSTYINPVKKQKSSNRAA